MIQKGKCEMKKISIKIVTVILLCVVLGTLFLPGVVDRYQSRQAAKGTLDNLVNQNYEEAFETIYYFDVASDLEPTIHFNEAESKWIQRVNDLKERGTYVTGYKGLNVKLDDAYPIGNVDLIIMENGKETLKKNVRLLFFQSDRGWSLGGFDFHSGKSADTEEDWERAWSGHIGSDA